MGVATQVALARRESPHAGSRLVRLAFAVTHEMPYLLALMESGLLSERRAALVVQECAVLSLDQRTRVDGNFARGFKRTGGRCASWCSGSDRSCTPTRFEGVEAEPKRHWRS